MPRPFAGCLLLLLLGLVSTVSAGAPADKLTLDQRIDALFRVRNIKQVALAPDGRWLAWVESVPATDPVKPPRPALFLTDLRTPKETPRRLKVGDGKDPLDGHDLAWSPDSRWLAFLSDHGVPEQEQLYLADVAAGTARKVTAVAGHLAKPGFAPSGEQVAILFTENAPRATGPTEPATAEVGVDRRKNLRAAPEHRQPRNGQGPARCRRPTTTSTSTTGRPTASNSSPSPPPATATTTGTSPSCCTLAADTGQVRTLLDPGMQIAVPRWSPDGRTIAFIGGLMSDEGINGGDIYTIPADGGKAQQSDPRPQGLRELARLAAVVTGHPLHRPRGRRQRHLHRWTWPAASRASGPARRPSGDGGPSTCRSARTTRRPPWSATPSTGRPKSGRGRSATGGSRRTCNAEQRPHWGEAKSLHWKSDDFTVQGWLLYPQDYDPKRRYPMVVSVHGGPASARRPGWPGTAFDFSLLSADGYFVFFPNPRGSYGQGEAFTRANVKDFGHGDLRDILAGVDDVVQHAAGR